MATVALSVALFAGVAAAQSSTVGFAPTPLDDVVFPRQSDAPYQVFGFNGHDIYTRGYQSGYNICNSTTENQDSLCQTITMNSIQDFCLWAPATQAMIADAEGEVVGWCSKKGHGTRIIPDGTFKALQLLSDGEAYMMTGFIDQTKINMIDGDFGGELDSGGQDGRGNPIGGLLYSTTFSPDSDPFQVRHWTEFIGNGAFCFKWCKDTGSNPDGKCQHTLDRIGLGFNCPSKYTLGAAPNDGLFEVCDSDSFPIPGVYTDSAGATQSYAQPPESLGAITTVPYTPTSAATRNCQTFASSDLFTDAVTAAAAAPTGKSSSGSASGTMSRSSAGAAPTSGSKSGSSNTNTNSTGSADGSSAAGEAFGMSLLVSAVGVLSAIAMFA